VPPPGECSNALPEETNQQIPPEETTMATCNLAEHWDLDPIKYQNRNLSQRAQEAFDAVNASSHPCQDVSWTDLYAIFGNSRQFLRDANGLDASADGDLRAMIEVLGEDHAHLRRLLFLVAIENLFHCGHQNAMKVLWIYGEELECVDMISRQLAETEEEMTQVQAHFEAVCV
jgi:hypothetical protein